jgi:hypothetical protein
MPFMRSYSTICPFDFKLQGGKGTPIFLQNAPKRGSDRSSRVKRLSTIAMTPGSCFL